MQTEIEALFQLPADQLDDKALRLFEAFLHSLNAGEVRAAEPDAGSPTGWRVNAWVKMGILLGFRLGTVVKFFGSETPSLTAFRGYGLDAQFFDKNTYPLKNLSARDGVRVVPGGSSIRSGAYLAPGVVCMPPMYINVGAYVDEGTMVDSHALVGSCAQIGKGVHLSAAAQIGGVLEPIGAIPVIVEDDVLVGGNCGIYEGTVVKRRAVLGSGVILNRSTPVYDLVTGEVHRATDDVPLVIPEGAVVVSGSRAVTQGPGKEMGISIYTPVIVKYRDEKTDARVQLEDFLR